MTNRPQFGTARLGFRSTPTMTVILAWIRLGDGPDEGDLIGRVEPLLDQVPLVFE